MKRIFFLLVLVVVVVAHFGSQAQAGTLVADGSPEWSALLEQGIAYPGNSYGSITFPITGTNNYNFTFDNEWLPGTGKHLHQDWQGLVGVTLTSADTAPGNMTQYSGSRLTEGNDFGVGAFTHNSGLFYETIGRGSFVINNGGTGVTQTWTMNMDFTNLSLGYLPAGTLMSFVDMGDGSLETMVLAGTIAAGGFDQWMTEIDYTLNSTTGVKDQQTPSYIGSSTYDIGIPPGGPILATGSADYVYMKTTQDLTALEIVTTQGPVGGSHGFKMAAPVPEPATMLLLGIGLLGVAITGRKKFFKK